MGCKCVSELDPNQGQYRHVKILCGPIICIALSPVQLVSVVGGWPWGSRIPTNVVPSKVLLGLLFLGLAMALIILS